MATPIFPIPTNDPAVVAFNQQYDLIWVALQLITLGVPLLIVFSGWGARLRTRLAQMAGKRSWLVLPLLASTTLALVALATLPVAWFLDIQHRAAWDRTVPDTASWLAGRGVSLLVQVLICFLFLWIAYRLIRRLPRAWWAVLALSLSTIIPAAVTAEQILVRPYTSDAKPYPAGPIRDKFEAILARCSAVDIPIDLVRGMENATVIGLGSTSRILIGDRVVDDFPDDQKPRQLSYTFAHELKHHLSGDNWLAFATVAAIIFGAAGTMYIGGRTIVGRHHKRIGFDTLADPASFPLLLALAMTFVTVIGIPTLNLVQQNVEEEADRFSIEVNRDPGAMAAWRIIISQSKWSLDEYYPFYRLYRATHPSPADGIRLTNSWRPWEQGNAGRYDAWCNQPVQNDREPR
jgi:Zn-dependent protease with chaperone function